MTTSGSTIPMSVFARAIVSSDEDVCEDSGKGGTTARARAVISEVCSAAAASAAADARCREDFACRFMCWPRTNLMQNCSMLIPAISLSEINRGFTEDLCFHFSRSEARPFRMLATVISGMAEVTWPADKGARDTARGMVLVLVLVLVLVPVALPAIVLMLYFCVAYSAYIK